MRYFLQLAYDGSPFHGWQRQPNALSVQQTLEESLGVVLRREITIVGAGRTDTGVNARKMYAHFDTPEPIADSRRFLNSMNRLCGHEISLERLLPVKDEAHARFDAVSRSYRYFVIFEQSPFLRRFAWESPTMLDVDAMNDAASLLVEACDFTSFAKLHSDARTNICDVREALWVPFENPYGISGVEFHITADRFLRNMVRAITGTLVDVGRGKLTPVDFRDVMERRDRCAAGTSMPAHPLFLWDIAYPADIFKTI